MKRELGFGCCGLACCLCSENDICPGCRSDGCPNAALCENRACASARGHTACSSCGALCRKGLLDKDKPYGFTLFIRRYGEKALLDCLERNERAGVVYHRTGIEGDYDGFKDPEDLIAFILEPEQRK